MNVTTYRLRCQYSGIVCMDSGVGSFEDGTSQELPYRNLSRVLWGGLIGGAPYSTVH